MLLFAVWRRSAVGDAQPAHAAHGKAVAGGTLVATDYSFLLFSRHLRRFGLGSYTVPDNMGSVVHRCSTFIRIKRGFGYTQEGGQSRKRPFSQLQEENGVNGVTLETRFFPSY
jgi:hypothetical protein